MQLSEDTIEILRNFSSIQPNLKVVAGSVVSTIAEAKNIFAKASLGQEFPKEFGIYDLSEFLNTVSLVETPDLSFEESCISIRDSVGRTRIRYHYSDPSILKFPTKDLVMPEVDVSFDLDEKTLTRLRRASSVLQYDKLVISPNETGNVSLTVADISDPTSNSFEIKVPGTYSSDKFNLVININNIKVLSGDYSVGLSKKLISQFKNKNRDVVYFIALEKSSTFGE